MKLLEADIPRQHLTRATFYMTTKCNFSCAHCIRGQAGKAEFSKADYGFSVAGINNVALNLLTHTGGEARLLSWFSELGSVTAQAISAKGGRLYTESSAGQNIHFNDLETTIKQLLPQVVHTQWAKSAEIVPFAFRKRIESGDYPNQRIQASLDTNCFGMKSPQDVVSILEAIYYQGFNNVRLGLTLPHQEYAVRAGWKIDYPFLQELVSNPEARKALSSKMHLSKVLKIGSSGCGKYVMPLGRAQNLNLGERLRLAGVVPSEIGKMAIEINQKLAWEYDHWEKILDGSWVIEDQGLAFGRKFTHCYCDPAIFYRTAERTMTFSPENQLHFWEIFIRPDMSVNLCPNDTLPSLGNLGLSTPQDLYEKALESKLYEVLGHGGPQGVARLISGWSDSEIKRRFIERTPCGMCADLRQGFPNQMQSLFEQDSDFARPIKNEGNKKRFLLFSC